MAKLKIRALVPLLGAAGFLVGCELSMRQPEHLLLWSLATVAWILLIFAILAFGKIRGQLVAVSIPAVVMIAVSTTTSLLFLDLTEPSRGLFIFCAVVLYLFLEHVRHEAEASSDEERRYLAEYARLVNVGSLFLVAATVQGLAIFLPIPWWAPVLAMMPVALIWSWHYHLACVTDCGQPRLRVLLTALVTVEAYLVAVRLPVTMYVGGVTVALAYYLAALFLALNPAAPETPRRARRYAVIALIMLILVYATTRWFA